MSTEVLLVIDLQNDFCPGGALAVPQGDQIVTLVNRLAQRFQHVVLTQDWHPAGHISFSSSHPGTQPYQQVQTTYGAQTLWPDHCVQGSAGADFHPDLDTSRAELILRKGFRREIDSYSAFQENDRATPTGLAGYLRDRRFERVFLCGLAYDFCVYFSAIDGRELGFETFVIEDATRPVDLPGSVEQTHRDLATAGILRVRSANLL